MAYVDLNPIRAKMATTPETSDYTSIHSGVQTGMLFPLNDCLQLVDWTGRIVRSDKRGAIPCSTPLILTDLNIPIDQWLQNGQQFEKVVHRRFRLAG